MEPLPNSQRVNLLETSDSRIARHCVCCGGTGLRASPAIMMPFISHRVFGWSPAYIDASWGLKTVPQGLAYALCNSLLCEDCELLFMDLRFSDDEMGRLYNDYRGPEYTGLREYYEPGYSVRNAELSKQVVYLRQTEEYLREFVAHPRCVLDWGGDTGINTPFKEVAEFVEIYDISNKLAHDGERTSNKARLRAKSYDLITCCNVLEHVPHPAKVLEEIKHFMDEATTLFIEVPLESLRLQADGMTALLTAKRHWHEHINFFSEKSLRLLIHNAGFKLLSIRTLTTNESGNQAHVYQVASRLGFSPEQRLGQEQDSRHTTNIQKPHPNERGS